MVEAESDDGVMSSIKSLFGGFADKLETAADYGLEIWKVKELGWDNASANPETAPYVTQGVQATGEPVLSMSGLTQNWPIWLALLVVVVAVVLLLARLF